MTKKLIAITVALIAGVLISLTYHRMSAAPSPCISATQCYEVAFYNTDFGLPFTYHSEQGGEFTASNNYVLLVVDIAINSTVIFGLGWAGIWLSKRRKSQKMISVVKDK